VALVRRRVLAPGLTRCETEAYLAARYESLWGELTREQVLRPEEQQSDPSSRQR
jgi:hypothetical protein